MFIVLWAMVGYPVILIGLDKVFKRENKKDYLYEPTVTIMIVAHNEEKVIEKKLLNILEIEYPLRKLEVIVTSDASTDSTDEIVNRFIQSHSDANIYLHKTKSHYGKTNAQNEAQELCRSEILVMTDANAMFEKNAVKELVASFTDSDIAYVTGRLCYVNTGANNTANSEGLYWKLDLMCRRIESRIQTITAGNGAIYAVRNNDYIKINSIDCHDLSFPMEYALKQKRAIYNQDAIAYEKAGEKDEDEFNRKTRMSRAILREICPSIRVFNVFRCHWFSFFYFGHRTCRYLLWLAHFVLLGVNVPLLIINNGWFWKATISVQIFFYIMATIGWITKREGKIFRFPFYYCMTVAAQWKGVFNIMMRKSKPVWEKAESTR